MQALPVLNSYAEVVSVMQAAMLRQGQDGRTVEILEAGCGTRWSVRLGEIKYRLTGVDMDADAVRIRMDERKDLDEAIVGNLLTVDLGDRKFDIIYNSFVLEHVEGAEALMHRFVSWLKPGGIIIIRIPDPHSVKGLITRVTPHWFHILYYRFVLRYAMAGQPGYPPYRTLYEPVVSRPGIHDFAKRRGVTIAAEYGSGGPHGGGRLIDRAIRAFTQAVSALSFGRYSNRHSDLLYVLRAPG